MSLGLVSQELEGLKSLGVGAPKSKIGVLGKESWRSGGWSITKSPSWSLATIHNQIYTYIVFISLHCLEF